MKVKIADFGYSERMNKFYVNYNVSDIKETDLNKLTERLEEDTVEKSGELSFNVYFDKKFYPFHTEESKKRLDDYIAREEIEMTAYLVDLLEED